MVANDLEEEEDWAETEADDEDELLLDKRDWNHVWTDELDWDEELDPTDDESESDEGEGDNEGGL